MFLFFHCFLLSKFVCSTSRSRAFVPMVTNANWPQGAKGSTWGSEWSLREREKKCAPLEELSTKVAQQLRVLPSKDGLWPA